MNDFSFSENSLAGVPAEGLREEAFSPRLQLEDARNRKKIYPAALPEAMDLLAEIFGA